MKMYSIFLNEKFLAIPAELLSRDYEKEEC